MYSMEELFDLEHTAAAEELRKLQYPWQMLPKIGDFIKALGPTLPQEEYDHPAEWVWIARSAKVAPTASITGPCIIGPETEVRHCAFIRGNALVGAGSITSNVKSDKTLVVVKNGTERIETGLKKFGAILGDCVEVGCGSILNPGSVVGRNSSIYPLSSVRTVVPANSIYKCQGEVAEKR